MYIHCDEKEQEKDTNCILNMQKYEFGIQPLQLFIKQFPEIKSKINFFKDLEAFNLEQFKKEHKKIFGDKMKCFECNGYANKYPDYLEIINKKLTFSKKKSLKNLSTRDKLQLAYHNKIIDTFNTFFHYIFIGDVLGSVTVFKNNVNGKDKSIIIENLKKNGEFNKSSDIYYKYKVVQKLNDHHKQIKYLDYNPRLNLFVSYALDGYINIYCLHKCKLVRTIKVSDLTKSNEILKKVVLVSNPFPMIFCYDINNMYAFTLNGDLIKKEPIRDKDIDLLPSIDKNCGLVQDVIFFKKIKEGVKEEEKDNICEGLKKIELPSLKQA